MTGEGVHHHHPQDDLMSRTLRSATQGPPGAAADDVLGGHGTGVDEEGCFIAWIWIPTNAYTDHAN